MSRKSILVADDSDTMRKVFELAFENEDVEVILTTNGREALEIAMSAVPAMVIADVNTPDMDGFELCRALKENDNTASIPVYLMSSAMEEFDEARYRAVGAQGRFEKPFRSEDMMSEVMAVLGSSDGGAPAPGIEEDTFDDVDESLDNIMESVQEEMALDDEISTPTVIDDQMIDDADGIVSAQILDLGQSMQVDDSQADDEADMEMEIISGMDSDEAEESVSDEELLGDTELMGETQDGDDHASMDEVEITQEAPTAAHEDVAGSPDEGRRMLEEIDKEVEEELDLATTGNQAAEPDEEEVDDALSGDTQLIAVSDEPSVNTAPPVVADVHIDQQTVTNATRTAFGEFLEKGDFQSVVDDAVAKSLKDMIGDDELKQVVEKGVSALLSEIGPRIIEEFTSTIRKSTLELAEDLIKQTIDQVKKGK